MALSIRRRARAAPELAVAPELAGLGRWWNTPDERPLTLAGLRGQVVLVDFWTFICGNCVRTLPFLTSLDHDLRDHGVTVLGIHTPELHADRNPRRVADAIRQHAIRYPVAQDNDCATWEAYGNRYWPTMYLIDRDGLIRHVQTGEGGYARTRRRVEELL